LRRLLALSFALLLIGGIPSVALAGVLLPGVARGSGKAGIRLDEPVHLTADTLTYDEDSGVATAEGNVELALGNRSMRADRIRYDSRTGEAELAGKVRYGDADEEFSFDRVVINLDKETGVLYNGTIRVRSSNYLITSERIEKTGKQSFAIRKGSFTTCPCDPEPDWKFDIRRSQATLDEYVYAKDVTFRIRGVPVFWLPWGAFPVKLSRQSGFLMPNFSSGRTKGYTVTVPYYWAINRWSEATLAMEAMSRRGYRPEAEYRFVLNPESEGTVLGTFFHDRPTDEYRWRVSGENVFRTGRWTANGRVEVPSDNTYYVDFVDSDLLRSARQTRSEGFLGRSGETMSQGISVTLYKEMEVPSQDNTIQRLPEYTATLLPAALPLGGIEAAGKISATNFRNSNGDHEVRAMGNAALSRTLVIYPSVTLTPYLFVDLLGDRYKPAAGAWESAGRAVPGGGATLSTEARRDFPRDGHGYVHLVGTTLGYRYVPGIAQDNIPLTDRWSRLAPQSQFVLSLTQRLLGVGEGTSPRELAALYLEWAYDVGGRVSSGTPYVDPLSPFVRSLRDQIDTGAGRPLETDAVSDVYAIVSANPFARWKFRGEALFSPLDAAFTLGAVGVEWRKDEDNRVLAGYRISRDLAEDLHGLVAWRPLRLLALQAQVNYSIQNGYITDGSAGLTVYPRSDCWSVGVSVEKKTQPDDTNVNLKFQLKGIGAIGN